MKRIFTAKMMSLTVAMVALVALVAMASNATGAYFSDTKPGAVSGTLGSIKVTTSGGVNNAGTSFVWDNMLPGELKSATVGYQNTGRNVQDVYLVFNPTALSALNTLGTFGEAHIAVNGTEIYASQNLNDIQGNGTAGVPGVVKIGSSVGPTASGNVTFSFMFAGKMQNPNLDTISEFNKFPIKTTGTHDSRYPIGFEQSIVRAIDGEGTGLPFKVIAVQVGQVPTF
jgi:hypothetical protein